MHKIHLIESTGWKSVFTYCGMTGYRTGVENEFDTTTNRRFEAVKIIRRVTCTKCVKAKAKETTNAD